MGQAGHTAHTVLPRDVRRHVRHDRRARLSPLPGQRRDIRYICYIRYILPGRDAPHDEHPPKDPTQTTNYRPQERWASGTRYMRRYMRYMRYWASGGRGHRAFA